MTDLELFANNDLSAAQSSPKVNVVGHRDSDPKVSKQHGAAGSFGPSFLASDRVAVDIGDDGAAELEQLAASASYQQRRRRPHRRLVLVDRRISRVAPSLHLNVPQLLAFRLSAA